jgi:hypothetical protein
MEATDDHKAKVADILRTSHMAETGIDWGGRRNEAFALYTAITGQRLKGGGCGSCDFTAANLFLSIAGLPAVHRAVPQRRYQQRLDICKGTDTTPRCEHLMPGGMNCGKCLCFVDIKARLKSMKCPVGKW